GATRDVSRVRRVNLSWDAPHRLMQQRKDLRSSTHHPSCCPYPFDAAGQRASSKGCSISRQPDRRDNRPPPLLVGRWGISNAPLALARVTLVDRRASGRAVT